LENQEFNLKDIIKMKKIIKQNCAFLLLMMTSYLALLSPTFSMKGALVEKSSDKGSTKKLNFTNLSYDKDDPESYTLACLDSSLIPQLQRKEPSKYKKEFNPVIRWLNPKILQEIESEGTSTSSWRTLSIVQRNQSEGIPYYIIKLSSKISTTPAEKLTTHLWGGTTTHADNMSYTASMIILPQKPDNLALVYLFGDWKQILNQHALIRDWGLHLAAHPDIVSDKKIKSLLGKNNFDPNPTSRTETKQRLAPIETFSLEIGTEGLQSLKILPKYSIGSTCQRLAEGKDCYKFFLPQKQSGSSDTLDSLVTMGSYLFSLSQQQPQVHPKLQFYMDERVVEKTLVEALEARLLEILPSENATMLVFPADDIWKSYGKGPLFSFGKNTNKKNLVDSLRDGKVLKDSHFSIQKAKQKTSFQEPIFRFIYTLPIEYKGEFYRFDRGRWFKVASSRFSLIKRKLRDSEIKVELDALVPYSSEDAIGDKKKDDDGKKKDNNGLYQEDRYNRRVISSMVGKKQKGILLDRLNIYLGGQGNKFEFGDLLLYEEKGPYYIVHVKRKEAGDIDHHRAQVERSAEYLATELNKKNAAKLLLQGCVNGLYLKNKISINKMKGQGARLTHGDIFEQLFTAKKKTKAQKWENYLKKQVFSNSKTEATTELGKFKIMLRNIDLNFFENHSNELIIALDALFDCQQKTKKMTQNDLEDFIGAIKQLIAAREVLLPSGIIPEATRKKISLVMAVIDDRQIEEKRKAEKALEKAKEGKKQDKATIKAAQKKLDTLKAKTRVKETELFKDQHLWGLDRTCQLVQKLGFHFKLTIINENTERERWDAFGKIEEELDYKDSKSIEEDGSDVDSIEKKSRSGKKKNSKANSSDKHDEEEAHDGSSSHSSSSEDENEDEKIKKYEYTSSDISRLIHLPLSHNQPQDGSYERFSLSGADADDEADMLDTVHRLNNRYVLPPIIASHPDEEDYKDPYEALIELLTNTFYTHQTIIDNPPEEMIIPFNPGGHWVTFHVQIPPEGNVVFRYYDSLTDMPIKESKMFRFFLRGKSCPRIVDFECLIPRIQPDSVSCGAITTENIKWLFRGEAIPDQHYTHAEILTLKKEHKDHLTDREFEFDFDK
jgi:hypothetical protein